MKLKTAFLVGSLLSLASLGVQAQTQAPPVRLNMDTGIYLGAGIGRARTGEGCLGTCDTSDKTWNVFAGYQFNRFFAAEAGYSDFGQTTISGLLFGAPVTSQAETTAWELVGLGLLPLSDKFSVYVKAGIFRFESDATTSGAAVGVTSRTGTEFTFGGGLQYTFANNFSGRLEWQAYNDVGAGVPGQEKDQIAVWRLIGRYKF